MTHRPSAPFFLAVGLVVAAGLPACGDGGPPAVDLTGVWIGTYSTQDGATGPILVDLTQSSSGELSGGLEVIGPAIPDGNSGVWVSGAVHGHEASITVNGADDRVTATEASGTLHGTIASGSVTAGFGASRVETRSMKVATTRPPGGRIPRLLAAQGGALWFYDWYDNSLQKTDDKGAVTATVKLETRGRCEGGFDGCGDKLLCSNAARLIWVDPSSSQVTAQTLPGGLHAGGVTCGPSNVWVDQGTTKAQNLQALNKTSGSPEGAGLHLPGILTDLAFDGTDLWALEFFPPILLRVSTSSGAILAAYQIPAARSTTTVLNGLTWDGNALWTLLTTHGGGGSDTVVAARLEVDRP